MKLQQCMFYCSPIKMSGSPSLLRTLDSDNKSPQLCTTLLSTSAWELSLHHHCLLGKFSSLVPHSVYVACFQTKNHCFLVFVCTGDLKSWLSTCFHCGVLWLVACIFDSHGFMLLNSKVFFVFF